MPTPALRASLGLRRLSTKAPNKLDVGALAKKVPLKGQTVLVRADLNLPLSKGDGPPTITDATRLIATSLFPCAHLSARVVEHAAFKRETGARWAEPEFAALLQGTATVGSCTATESCEVEQVAAAAIEAPEDNPFDDYAWCRKHTSCTSPEASAPVLSSISLVRYMRSVRPHPTACTRVCESVPSGHTPRTMLPWQKVASGCETM